MRTLNNAHLAGAGLPDYAKIPNEPEGQKARPKNSISMSKGNMLLGHARGKVGDLVFSRSNGQQVTRARAAVVKNPQTEKQMVQRILLNTVAQAYSRMSAITDHSFEGIQQGQKSMSFFMAKNIDALRSKIAAEIAAGGDFGNVYAFVPINTNEYAANDFIISKGSLPELSVTFNLSASAQVNLSGTTYGDIIAALGLQRGDQLTFVTTQGLTGARTTFHYARVILDPTTLEGSSASLDTPFIVDGAINLPSPRNEGEFNLITFDEGVLTYNFAATPVSGAAVIVSRQKADGTWLRSNATLLANETAIGGWQKSLQDCLDLFASGSIDTLSEQYLNNAGRGRLAAAEKNTIVKLVSVGEGEGFDRFSEVDAIAVAKTTMTYNGRTVPAVKLSDGAVVPVASTNRYSRTYEKVLISDEIPANSYTGQDWAVPYSGEQWKLAGDETTPEGEQIIPEKFVQPTSLTSEWISINGWEGLVALGFPAELFTNSI